MIAKIKNKFKSFFSKRENKILVVAILIILIIVLIVAIAFKKEDEKIYNRELIRFEASLKKASALSDIIVAALHYPPDEQFLSIAQRYGVSRLVFGHLHGKKAEEYKNIYKNTMLVSADFREFTPICII